MSFGCSTVNCLTLNKTGYNWLAVPDTVRRPPQDVPLPEPGSLALAGLALFGLAVARRRKI
jgi:hypothetical protein